MHNWSVSFDMSTADDGFGHLAEFKTFLVGVLIICFTLGPPTSRR